MRAIPRRRLVTVLGAILAWSAFAVGCSTSPAAPDPTGSEVVRFDATDGVHLEGRLFGDGTAAVVLSHMRPADQSSWYRMAQRLADAGYVALTYNFRGYCPGGRDGCSDGERDIAELWRDVAGAVEFVRGRGATSVSLVGASMGGTASIVAAAREGLDVRAVITLSAPLSIEGLVVDGPLLTSLTALMLFIAGGGDASAAADAESLYRQAPPPKNVQIVPSDAHGTDLLTSGQGEVVRRHIETTLEQAGGP